MKRYLAGVLILFSCSAASGVPKKKEYTEAEKTLLCRKGILKRAECRQCTQTAFGTVCQDKLAKHTRVKNKKAGKK